MSILIKWLYGRDAALNFFGLEGFLNRVTTEIEYIGPAYSTTNDAALLLLDIVKDIHVDIENTIFYANFVSFDHEYLEILQNAVATEPGLIFTQQTSQRTESSLPIGTNGFSRKFQDDNYALISPVTMFTRIQEPPLEDAANTFNETKPGLVPLIFSNELLPAPLYIQGKFVEQSADYSLTGTFPLLNLWLRPASIRPTDKQPTVDMNPLFTTSCRKYYPTSVSNPSKSKTTEMLNEQRQFHKRNGYYNFWLDDLNFITSVYKRFNNEQSPAICNGLWQRILRNFFGMFNAHILTTEPDDDHTAYSTPAQSPMSFEIYYDTPNMLRLDIIPYTVRSSFYYNIAARLHMGGKMVTDAQGYIGDNVAVTKELTLTGEQNGVI